MKTVVVPASSEKHYTIQELARLWHCCEETVRRQARKETEGVLRFGEVRITMTISESAKNRMYLRLSRPNC